ncbi:MAG: hypothetical protein OEL89_03410 [Candidatus Peregrinibacteria bacterium]|nr:hypothetical protein [Candidatus Peregrinibacteria bacterium]
MNIQDVKTKSGKTIADFVVPEKLLANDPALVELILKSESMNDDERQYWLNLTDVMTGEQVEKLRGILVRERDKLLEIDRKYGKAPQLTAEEIAQKNTQIEQKKAEQMEDLRRREAESEKAEDEESILAELNEV